jgi:hypothetical protein
MREFWRLLSILVSLAGFLVVAGVLLYKGDAVLSAAIKAAAAFAFLMFTQRVMTGVLGLAADSRPAPGPAEGDERK